MRSRKAKISLALLQTRAWAGANIVEKMQHAGAPDQVGRGKGPAREIIAAARASVNLLRRITRDSEWQKRWRRMQHDRTKGYRGEDGRAKRSFARGMTKLAKKAEDLRMGNAVPRTDPQGKGDRRRAVCAAQHASGGIKPACCEDGSQGRVAASAIRFLANQW